LNQSLDLALESLEAIDAPMTAREELALAAGLLIGGGVGLIVGVLIT
jgi:hypothetical protein